MTLHNLSFQRSDNKPFKILSRGDCTSRRTVMLNRDLFPKGVTFVQNEKSPVIFFLDALQGITSTPEKLEKISKTDEMPRTLRDFYLGQADRSILSEVDADMIMMDSYADMNFEIWEHNLEKWKCWVHPKYLKNPEEFYQDFSSVKRRSLVQSKKDCIQLIKELRKNNPYAVVLFLNQQIEFYPKMEKRRQFYDLGKLVAEKIPGAFFGGTIDKEDLKLDDVGSCGPGLTLHFQPETYREMLKNAASEGLLTTLDERKKYSHAQKDVTKIQQEKSIKSEDILLRYGSDYCTDKCGDTELVIKSLSNYMVVDGYPRARNETPAVIDVDDIRDYETWEHGVKKKYDRLRMKKKAEKLGYTTHLFNLRLHNEDRFNIHNSMSIRAGKPIQGSYLQTVEEMGGKPTKKLDPAMPNCPYHWTLSFGVFQSKSGHAQGAVVVDEELVGYIKAKRIGDILLYSVISGHGDHLSDGIMYLLHFNTVRWVSDNLKGYTKNLKYIMYGAVEHGHKGGLWQWKRTVGFNPCYLYAYAGRI